MCHNSRRRRRDAPPPKRQEAMRLLRKLRPLAVCVLCLLLLAPCAWAAGPVLTAAAPFPTEGQPGQPQVLRVIYSDLNGDPPTSIIMQIQTPNGVATVPATQPSGTDPAQGITYTFTFTPQNTGTYKYRFEAKSSTTQSAALPDTGDFEFTSYSLVTKYVFLVIGLILALAGLPYLVYIVARSVNKRGNPATAARAGLFLGVLAAYALYWYLFAGVYHMMGEAIAAVAALALLVALLTKR